MKSVSTGSLAMSQQTGFDRQRASGFSLVEVLCALAIASMAMVTLLGGLGTSQHASNQLESYLGARIIVQSILEDEMSSAGTAPAQREGKSGIYVWRLNIEPASTADFGTLPSGFKLYRLTAEVTWAPRGRFFAETLKLAK